MNRYTKYIHTNIDFLCNPNKDNDQQKGTLLGTLFIAKIKYTYIHLFYLAIL